MKILKSAVALSVLLTMLVACGDESTSSSVIPEPADDSSSSVAPASSSSKKDENSSSSVEKAKESSSSVKPSSSSVTPKSSSSEEVKQSSSSVVASSSSVTEQSSSSKKQNPWGTNVDWQPFNLADYGDLYAEFTDPRNNRTYKYLTFNGENLNGEKASIKVMVENLNIGEMIDGSADQKDDSKVERYCYDNDTLICHYYGGLYQWAEMMQLPSRCNKEHCADLIKPNHQGICPDGWRLLTYDDFFVVLNSNGNTHGVEGLRSTFGFGGYNSTGYSLVGAGYNWKYQFRNLTTGTYWFYPEESEEVNYPEEGAASFTTDSGTNTGKFFYLKTHGFSVRCVMVE